MTGYAFDEGRHVHTLNGKRLHGVTSVLKQWGDSGALIMWAVNCAVNHIEVGMLDNPAELQPLYDEARKAHTQKRDAAGDRGKEVHRELELYFKYPNFTDLTEPSSSVVAWLTTEGYTVLESELNIWSAEHWYGGIIDAIVEKDGELFILDFKTSKSIRSTYLYQMGAYSVAYRERTGKSVAGVIIVHIPEGKSFNSKRNVLISRDIEGLERCWLNILETYKMDAVYQKLCQPFIKKKK